MTVTIKPKSAKNQIRSHRSRLCATVCQVYTATHIIYGATNEVSSSLFYKEEVSSSSKSTSGVTQFAVITAKFIEFTVEDSGEQGPGPFVGNHCLLEREIITNHIQLKQPRRIFQVRLPLSILLTRSTYRRTPHPRYPVEYRK